MDSSLVVQAAQGAIGLVGRFFKYPIAMMYADQFETKMGYVFAVDVCSKNKRVISIPKSSFKIAVLLDDDEARKAEKDKLIYGESVDVFDSDVVLQAFIQGRSFGNVRASVECHSRPQRLYLLVRVKGPDSHNPSLRFCLGRVYRTVKVKIVKRLLSLTYLEIPIRHFAIIAGNDKTQITES